MGRASVAVVTLASVTSMLAFVFVSGPIGCGSSDPAPPAVVSPDGGDDTVADIPEFEEPVFDSDDPAGRVLVLKIYDPVLRCYGLPTGIGHYGTAPDGGLADCLDTEVCYVRTDGVLAYNSKDCVPPKSFLANWDKRLYSDLEGCELLKHVGIGAADKIRDCPATTCLPIARDVTIDTSRSCATAITSVGCRSDLGKPTSCWCSSSSPASVFVAAKATGGTTPSGDFKVCDSTNPACAKALAIVDTVEGCKGTPPTDAGPETSTDASTDTPLEGG